MDASATPPPDRSALDGLERIAKSFVWLLPAIYGFGFVVVSVHHWHHGIAHIELLKPQVLASGLTLVVITGVGWVMGQAALHRSGGPLDEEHADYVVWLRHFAFVALESVTAAWFLWVAIFEKPFSDLPSPSWWDALALVSGVVILIVLLFVWKPLSNSRFRWLGAVLFAAAIVLVLARPDLLPPARMLTWWLFGVACIPAFEKLPFVQNRIRGITLRTLPWTYQLPYFAVLLLVSYATNIYPQISPTWGGGAPVEAVISVAAGDSERTEKTVLILEETDQGFYFQVEDPIKGTLFLPRDSVKSILIPIRTRWTKVRPSERRPR